MSWWGIIGYRKIAALPGHTVRSPVADAYYRINKAVELVSR